MQDAREYGFDGINLDFEGLRSEAGPHYVQFIRELSIACRKEGIVLSIDNYVPSAYTEFYNRREQGIVADYVIIMGYDEHYAGGEAGPVSSISFVDNGIKDTLEVVPKEKVINAIPFYTRLWTTDGESQTSQVLIWKKERRSGFRKIQDWNRSGEKTWDCTMHSAREKMDWNSSGWRKSGLLGKKWT